MQILRFCQAGAPLQASGVKSIRPAGGIRDVWDRIMEPFDPEEEAEIPEQRDAEESIQEAMDME